MMNTGTANAGHNGQNVNEMPFGGFLDRLPQAMYVMAHVVFLAAGVWMTLRASDNGLPHATVLALYVASQVGFLAYFARAITMKLAVLVEQTLVFVMLLAVVL
jgi:hypothetical protein